MLTNIAVNVVFSISHDRGRVHITRVPCHPSQSHRFFWCERRHSYYARDRFTPMVVDGQTLCFELYRHVLFQWENGDYHWNPETIEEPDEDAEENEHPLGLCSHGAGFRSSIKGGESLSIELEVMVGIQQSKFRNDMIDAGADDAEVDGSLHTDEGAEIIFGSTRLEDIELKVAGICSVLGKYKCTGHNACDEDHEYGMHVSVSMRGWKIKPATLAKMVLLIDNNEELFEKIAQRSSAQWARYSYRTVGGVLLKMQERNKYEALAIRSNDRIEFRLFRSNTRQDRILKNCECVVSVIRYCKSVINHKNISAEDYARFVVENKKEYPNLAAFLDEVGVTKQKQTA